MPLGDYLAGLAFLTVTLAALALAVRLVVRRRLPAFEGVPLVLACFLTGAAGLIAVHLVPAALTILARESVLGCAVLVLAACTRLPMAKGHRQAAPERARAQPTSKLSWVVAGVGVVLVAAHLVTSFNDTVTTAVTDIDAMSFTLPGIVSWMQEGSVWQNVVLIPGFPVGTYPNNGDVLFLSTMLPWDNDAFVRPLTYVFLAFTSLGVYGLARELGAPRSSAVLFAVLPLTIRVLTVPAVESAKPDAFMTAAFVAGLLFLVRHARTRATPDLVLAGLGLGLAFGARWYGVLFAPATLAVWAISMKLARVPVRRIAGLFVLCGAVMLAAGGFWLLRNWVVTGNPLFPVKIAPFGVTIFDAGDDPIRERFGFTVAHYLASDWRVVREVIYPDWVKAFGGPGLLLVTVLLAAPAAAAVAWRRARRLARGEAVILALAALAVLLELIYVNIPATAQGEEGAPFPGLVGGNSRYAVPGLLIGAALGAWLCGRLGRGRLVLEVLAVVAIFEGLPRSFASPPERVGLVGALALLAALALVGLVLAVRRAAPERMRPVGVVGGGVAALVAVAVAGHVDQSAFNERRYRDIDSLVDAVDAQPAGTRVGVVGDWAGFVPIHPASGPRFDNEVSYVGYFDKGQLRKYSSEQRFRASLRKDGYDALLIGRGVRPQPIVFWERWARKEGYARVEENASFTLLRARR